MPPPPSTMAKSGISPCRPERGLVIQPSVLLIGTLRALPCVGQLAFFNVFGKRNDRGMESVQVSGSAGLTEDLFGGILPRARLLAGVSAGLRFGVLCFDTVTSRTASKHLSQMFQGSERGVALARCSVSFYFQSHSFPGGASGNEPAC